MENKFCSYFDSADIKALLQGFNKNSDHMLINIFQLVLTNCLGCVLAGKEVRSLDITKADRAYLKSNMEKLSMTELVKLIISSAEKLCEAFFIEDKKLVEYVDKTACKIIPEINRAIRTDTLEKFFITLNKPMKKALKYEDGKSLSNTAFREITEEIRDCSNAEEKIEIIREELHSLKDLVDVLGADCIFDDEFMDVFKALEDFEIALLIKSISNDSVWDNDYGTESEKEWQEKLRVYVEGLDEVKKGEIISISQGIEF